MNTCMSKIKRSDNKSIFVVSLSHCEGWTIDVDVLNILCWTENGNLQEKRLLAKTKMSIKNDNDAVDADADDDNNDDAVAATATSKSDFSCVKPKSIQQRVKLMECVATERSNVNEALVARNLFIHLTKCFPNGIVLNFSFINGRNHLRFSLHFVCFDFQEDFTFYSILFLLLWYMNIIEYWWVTEYCVTAVFFETQMFHWFAPVKHSPRVFSV